MHKHGQFQSKDWNKRSTEISLKTQVIGLQTSIKPIFEPRILKDNTSVCYTDDLAALESLFAKHNKAQQKPASKTNYKGNINDKYGINKSNNNKSKSDPNSNTDKSNKTDSESSTLKASKANHSLLHPMPRVGKRFQQRRR